MWSQNATQKSQKVFVHVPSEIAAHEVEEIGMRNAYVLNVNPFFVLNCKLGAAYIICFIYLVLIFICCPV